MFHWFSPFALPESVVADLSSSGGEVWQPRAEPMPAALLGIYFSPHESLAPASKLIARYQELNSLLPNAQLCHLDRLRSYPSGEWENLAKGMQLDRIHDVNLTTPGPLQALVTLALLRESPTILDAYLDLELSSILAGTTPDSDYQQRLRQASQAEAVLDALQWQIERQRQLEEELGEFRQDRKDKEKALAKSQRQAQSTRAQLESCLAELEDYYLQGEQRMQLVEAQQTQLERAAQVIHRMNSIEGGRFNRASQPPLQMLALLEGYRHSLKRAERFLLGGSGGNASNAS